MRWQKEIWAHRGGGGEAPENTIPAIRQALRKGVFGIEIDVRLTKDKAPVVIHDKTVDRTTDGKGEVSRMTLSEIRRLDAGYRFERDGRYPFRGKGIRIPTLEEVLAVMKDLPLNIELKSREPELVPIVYGLLVGMGGYGRFLIASQSTGQIRQFRRLCRDCIGTAASITETFRFLTPVGFSPKFQAVEIPYQWKCINFLPLSHIIIRKSHRTNVKTFVWTINDAKELLIWNKTGIDAILTDYPAQALDLAEPRK